jgi:hypothetical protein
MVGAFGPALNAGNPVTGSVTSFVRWGRFLRGVVLPLCNCEMSLLIGFDVGWNSDWQEETFTVYRRRLMGRVSDCPFLRI